MFYYLARTYVPEKLVFRGIDHQMLHVSPGEVGAVILQTRVKRCISDGGLVLEFAREKRILGLKCEGEDTSSEGRRS